MLTDPPEIDTYSSIPKTKTALGAKASLTCIATAVPAARFTWIHPKGKK